MRSRRHLVALLTTAAIPLNAGSLAPAAAQIETVTLTPCRVANVPIEIRCGSYAVYEDRVRRRGRRVPLLIRVLPAITEHPPADPLVLVSPGGPGLTNSEGVAAGYFDAMRQDRDIIMVDLRGTSGPNRLDCITPGSADHPAAYLDTPFDPAVTRSCREDLSTRADLHFYTTRLVVDDLHEVLGALGYAKTPVNLWGASGGTREVLEYVRRYPASVRAAIVQGTAPVTFKNPLPHAAAAQEALDSLFAQCAHDQACNSAFPRSHDEFYQVLDSLKARPVRVPIPGELGGRDSSVEITWQKLGEVVRTMSYTMGTERQIPYVIHRAAAGDFVPLVTSGIAASHRTRDAIRMGFLLSQTCTEDVPRITDAEIARDTKNTYLGETRVRQQRAACAEWPRGTVTADDFTPVRSDVPVLLISGTIDPVTRPRFAADAARYLKHSIHVIAPGGHTPGGPCINAIKRDFLTRASADGIDTSCVASMTLPPFRTS